MRTTVFQISHSISRLAGVTGMTFIWFFPCFSHVFPICFTKSLRNSTLQKIRRNSRLRAAPLADLRGDAPRETWGLSRWAVSPSDWTKKNGESTWINHETMFYFFSPWKFNGLLSVLVWFSFNLSLSVWRKRWGTSLKRPRTASVRGSRIPFGNQRCLRSEKPGYCRFLHGKISSKSMG